MQKLLQVMELLRDKEHGCPWDLKQNLKSLAKYTLEEVYEVVDAIESDNDEQLVDELGDLLFQVVFYAQIASEEGRFKFDDIVDAIVDKLLRRHPHVFPGESIENFGQKQLLDANQVVDNWEGIKAKERLAKNMQERSDLSESILRDIPVAIPAMDRALKIQKRVARVGFDWPEVNPVFEKLKEEVAEIEQALAAENREQVADEVGDAFFALINLARHLQVDPESSLRSTNKKFCSRFEYIERHLIESRLSIGDVPSDELERLWQEAKRLET